MGAASTSSGGQSTATPTVRRHDEHKQLLRPPGPAQVAGYNRMMGRPSCLDWWGGRSRVRGAAGGSVGAAVAKNRRSLPRFSCPSAHLGSSRNSGCATPLFDDLVHAPIASGHDDPARARPHRGTRRGRRLPSHRTDVGRRRRSYCARSSAGSPTPPKIPRWSGCWPSSGATSMSLAQAQELSDAVMRFRASGKDTIAWAETFGELGRGTTAYVLATGSPSCGCSPRAAWGSWARRQPACSSAAPSIVPTSSLCSPSATSTRTPWTACCAPSSARRTARLPSAWPHPPTSRSSPPSQAPAACPRTRCASSSIGRRSLPPRPWKQGSSITSGIESRS